MCNNIYNIQYTFTLSIVQLVRLHTSDHRCRFYDAHTKVKLTMNNKPAPTSRAIIWNFYKKATPGVCIAR